MSLVYEIQLQLRAHESPRLSKRGMKCDFLIEAGAVGDLTKNVDSAILEIWTINMNVTMYISWCIT